MTYIKEEPMPATGPMCHARAHVCALSLALATTSFMACSEAFAAPSYQLTVLPALTQLATTDGHFDAVATNAAGVQVGTLMLAAPQQVNLPDIEGALGSTVTRYTLAEREAAILSQGQLLRLGTLGRLNSQALGVNAQGQVIGESSNSVHSAAGSLGQAGGASETFSETHAFLYANGQTQDLGTLGGHFSSAQAINAQGQVIGDASTAGDAARFGYVYSNGAMSSLGGLGATSSHANAINDAGTVTGWYLGSDGHQNAFVYQNGVMSTLNVPGLSSEGIAVSSDGRIVGNVTTANGDKQLFVSENGSIRLIDGLPANFTTQLLSEAQGINAQGQVVGHTLTDEYHAFIDIDGQVTDLNDALLPSSSTRPLQLRDALSIDDQGRIVALGSGGIRYLLTPVGAVPEASNMAMWALGLAGLIGHGRLRRRSLSAWRSSLQV
jgi:probable HAF family extracellular repeat protein